MELFPYLRLLFYLKHFHHLNFTLETLCLFGVGVSFILWEGHYNPTLSYVKGQT